MAVGNVRRPFLASQDPYLRADALLSKGLEEAVVAKAALWKALLRIDPRPRERNPRRALASLDRAARVSALASATDAGEPGRLQNATCDVRYDANLGVTHMVGRIEVERSGKELAPILDPRSWSC